MGVDMAFYIQNFTQMHFNTTLQPNTEFTFQYDLYPNPHNLDVDSKYQLALSLFYENELEFFADTFFNQTVNFYEKGGETDIQTVFLYFVLAGFSGLVFYFLSIKCKKSTGPVESGTSDGAITADEVGTVKSANSTRAANEKAGGLRRAKGKKNSTAKKKAKKAAKAKKPPRGLQKRRTRRSRTKLVLPIQYQPREMCAGQEEICTADAFCRIALLFN